MYPPRFVPNFIKCNIHIPSIYLDTLYWPRFHRVCDESAFCTSVTTKSCAWEPCSPPDYKNHAAAWTATEIPILIHLSFSRYVNDGRPFWQYISISSTVCSDLQYFWGTVSALYNWKGEIQCAIKMGFDLLLIAHCISPFQLYSADTVPPKVL